MGDWNTKTLGEIAELIMGQSPEGKYYNSEGKGMPFLQGCSEFGKYHPDTTVYSTDAKKIAPKSSILFSVRAPVGKTNLADKAYCIGRGIAAIKGKTVDNDFLNHSIFFKNINDGFTSQGSTFASINYSELSKLAIYLPDEKKEQATIATILTTIDQAIEGTEQLIAKYERIKTGLMQDLLTRGIDEQRNIRTEETHEFKDSGLGRIPKEWEIYKISDLGEWKGGKTPRKSVRRFWNNAQCLWYTSKDIVKDVLTDSFYKITEEAVNETNQTVFPAFESLIFVFRSGILRHTFPIARSNTRFSVNQDLKVLVPKKGISSDFLFQKFKSLESYFLKVAVKVGTTVESVDGHVFFNIEGGIPQAQEQEKITEILKGVDAEIELLTLGLVKYHRQKIALMQDLLTGKVRVDNMASDITSKIIKYGIVQ